MRAVRILGWEGESAWSLMEMLELFGVVTDFRVHSCLSVLVGMEWKRREVVCVIFICLCALA